MKKILAILLLLFGFVFAGCSDQTIEEAVCPICGNVPYAQKETHPALDAHTPTTFDAGSVNYSKTVEIGDGVKQITVDFKLNNGRLSRVVCTEVDLEKASIVAGSTNNATGFTKLSKICDQATSYEEDNEGIKVMVAMNADFFGNGVSVNAFVKDSTIVKAAHNDNKYYDYTNVNADLPASMPMLFGVSGSTAQIKPIIDNPDVETTVKSNLFYEFYLSTEDSSKLVSTDMNLNIYACDNDKVNYIYKTGRELTAPSDSKVLKVERHYDDSSRVHGKIIEITETTKSTKYKATKDYFYVVIPNKLNIEGIEVGKYVSYNINSADDSWKYYDTIIGCRQALVIDGVIPATVKLENSNGAQSTNIPRSAIGVKPDGTVVLFSVESLRYGAGNYKDGDPYGLNLPQLADFMRYYGVYSGANFDGGGSTSLLTRSGFNGSGEFEVVVRSSDYGTTSITASRNVINSVLVVTKPTSEE